MFNITIISRSSGFRWHMVNLDLVAYTLMLKQFSDGKYIVIC